MGNEPSIEAPTTSTPATSLKPINRFSEYNWTPSFSSLRPPLTSVPITEDEDLPEYIDLRKHMPDIPYGDSQYSQVCKAVVTAINYEMVMHPEIPTFPPSEQFLYYMLKFSIGVDQLHSFGHVSQAISRFGICSTGDYKGNHPTDEVFELALPYRHIRLLPVQIEETTSVLRNGHVILLGMPVYSSFMKTQTDPVLTTDPDDFLLGGLCGIIVGYTEREQHYTVMVCRGKGWGARGYIQVPYGLLAEFGVELCRVDLRAEIIQLETQSSRSRLSMHSMHSSTSKKNELTTSTSSNSLHMIF
jgi:hypothetical protein